ncbi:MAG: PQQ-binding-like beta-propeller repeat protein [Paracoccaceae bacterium]
MKLVQGVGILVLLGMAAGCGNREVILPGERYAVRDAVEAGAEGDVPAQKSDGSGRDPIDPAENETRPINLPAPQVLAEWPQKSGNAEHLVANSALGASLSQVWSVAIGSGDSRKYVITADPVVAGGRVFTLDSRSRVMAHSTDGSTLWSADLTPPSDNNKDATGGGLAFGDGRLFATTGFGALVALDPATGKTLWVQKTEAAVTGAPAYRDGLVYVVSRDNRAWAIKADDGRVQWQLPGTPSPSGLVGGAAPAVTDRLAIFPFGSSEVVATLRKSGVRVWGSLVSGQRRGRVYAQVTDITGDPVVDGDTIYVANQSGRTVAMSASSGERIWTAENGAYSPVLPVGGSVFLVSDQAELVRLDAATGERIWAVDLPYFTKERPKRHRTVFAHYGPVMAGGRLLVASDDGLIRVFSPESGALLGSVALPGGATTNPVIVNRTLYVVSADGKLHAFR